MFSTWVNKQRYVMKCHFWSSPKPFWIIQKKNCGSVQKKLDLSKTIVDILKDINQGKKQSHLSTTYQLAIGIGYQRFENLGNFWLSPKEFELKTRHNTIKN